MTRLTAFFNLSSALVFALAVEYDHQTIAAIAMGTFVAWNLYDLVMGDIG